MVLTFLTCFATSLTVSGIASAVKVEATCFATSLTVSGIASAVKVEAM